MQITLKSEFEWFLSDEFKQLREGFEPTDNSEYLLSSKKHEERSRVERKNTPWHTRKYDSRG
jgi:hypothetical protein